jgi:hypothetical protein
MLSFRHSEHSRLILISRRWFYKIILYLALSANCSDIFEFISRIRQTTRENRLNHVADVFNIKHALHCRVRAVVDNITEIFY